MNKEEYILEEVEKTLNSIDALHKLEVNPFLYTRIKTRIENDTDIYSRKEKVVFVLKPATLVLILLLNIITAVYFLGTSGGNVTESSLVDTMKQEYGVTQIQADNYTLE